MKFFMKAQSATSWLVDETRGRTRRGEPNNRIPFRSGFLVLVTTTAGLAPGQKPPQQDRQGRRHGSGAVGRRGEGHDVQKTLDRCRRPLDAHLGADVEHAHAGAAVVEARLHALEVGQAEGRPHDGVDRAERLKEHLGTQHRLQMPGRDAAPLRVASRRDPHADAVDDEGRQPVAGLDDGGVDVRPIRREEQAVGVGGPPEEVAGGGQALAQGAIVLLRRGVLAPDTILPVKCRDFGTG